jgi:hypothetical protein
MKEDKLLLELHLVSAAIAALILIIVYSIDWSMVL